jgi:hypothetical protein
VKALADSVELEYRAGPGFSSTDRRDSSGVLKIFEDHLLSLRNHDRYQV